MTTNEGNHCARVYYCVLPLPPLSLMCVCVESLTSSCVASRAAPPALGALFTLLLPAACLLLPPSLSPLSLRAGVNDRVWPTD